MSSNTNGAELVPDTSGRRSYQVHLDVFEGPFHLLLSLISERRVDVCDVPIAQLTEDYLARLDQMRELDLDVTTEFIVVAATLLQLKARVLLPAAPDDEDAFGDQDLERDLLIARLLEVRTFQAAGTHLAELIATGDLRYAAAPAPDDEGLRQLPTLADIDAAALAQTIIDIVRDRARPIDTALLVGDEISTQDATALLVDELSDGPVTFRDVAGGRSLAWGVALFLAMLELAMRGEIELVQGERLGDIRIEMRAA